MTRTQSDTSQLTVTGHAPAPIAGRIAWTFYEFGGGPYFVMTQIFVFAAYFANGVVQDDPVNGQAWWAYTSGSTGLLIALLSPITGAIADKYGPRKPGLALFTMLAAPFIAALWFATPGNIAVAVICTVCAGALFELGFVFHNAMLPDIAPARRIGVISAAGYAMAYAGAIIAFAISLSMPLWGFGGGPEHGYAQERAAGMIAACFAVTFMLPLLVLAPDTPRTGRTIKQCIGEGFASLASTLRKARAYRNVVLFMVARMIYYDGLMAVFALIGIYAASVFGWGVEVQYYGLLIIITAAVSAVVGGMADDAFGSRRTILISLAIFAICLAANLGTDPHTLWYVVPLTPGEAAAQLPFIGSVLASMGFDTLPEQSFLLIGIVSGLFVGPALSSSRTLMARLAPQGQTAEFFGLYNLTGKATAFLAPTAIGLMTQASGDQRTGLGVIFVFIGLGFVLLLFVREPGRSAQLNP